MQQGQACAASTWTFYPPPPRDASPTPVGVPLPPPKVLLCVPVKQLRHPQALTITWGGSCRSAAEGKGHSGCGGTKAAPSVEKRQQLQGRSCSSLITGQDLLSTSWGSSSFPASLCPELLSPVGVPHEVFLQLSKAQAGPSWKPNPSWSFCPRPHLRLKVMVKEREGPGLVSTFLATPGQERTSRSHPDPHSLCPIQGPEIMLQGKTKVLAGPERPQSGPE